MSKLAAVILAAGQGTRMKSKTPKVLHTLAGRPLLKYALDLARSIDAKPIVVVVGHGAKAVRGTFDSDDLVFVEQKRQLGTGHAVKSARKILQEHVGEILILSGDVPLLEKVTLRGLVEHHRAKGVRFTALVGRLDDPSSYGRILRDPQGRVLRVVEEQDATKEELEISEVNAGTYCADAQALFKALDTLQRNNVQGEYYLTDVVAALAAMGVETFPASSPDELLGINDRVDLAMVEEIMQGRLRTYWMQEGVTLLDPGTVYLASDVQIGRDTVLEPQVILRGQSRIGERCQIGTGSVIEDSILEDSVTVRPYSVIVRSHIASGASIGPFAHLRIGSDIGPDARIGNFVEVKKSRLGRGSKASHLTYLGDTEIGKGVNIGAGTVTCNYDGVAKHRTVVEDDVFVGSNTELVAPVVVGKGALVGAGSTITQDVPPGALAVARSRQLNLKGQARRRTRKKG
jgi:bifunctional UDP-N-acetylglucosamine pyrophosphorylase/glucosamine-1-phosphate N-acetyltransferase